MCVSHDVSHSVTHHVVMFCFSRYTAAAYPTELQASADSHVPPQRCLDVSLLAEGLLYLADAFLMCGDSGACCILQALSMWRQLTVMSTSPLQASMACR
jgi:hypothetical protein